MKKLLTSIVLCITIITAQSQCVQEDIASGMVSINHKGLTLEIGRIAQITRVGFILGVTGYLSQEQGTMYVYDPEKGTNVEKPNGEYYTAVHGDMHLYATYMIIHKDYKYSLHGLAGAVFDLEKGLYASGGAELRIPANTHMYFVRALYPGDYRVGIIFRL